MDLQHINETLQKYMTGELERVPDLSMAEFTPIEAAVAKQSIQRGGGKAKRSSKVFDDKLVDSEAKETLGASEVSGNLIADANAEDRLAALQKRRMQLLGQGDRFCVEEEAKAQSLKKTITNVDQDEQTTLNVFKQSTINDKLKGRVKKGGDMKKGEVKKQLEEIED